MYNIKLFFNRLSVVLFLSSLSLFSISSFAQNASQELPTHHAHVKNAKGEMESASVNINTADARAISNAHIKGIGKKRAEAIVTYRTQHGPFKSVDELKNVKGLSDKVIDENREKLKIN